MKSKKIMITGGAGFIGVNLIKLILSEYPQWDVVNYDLLTYAGNLESLKDLQDHPNYQFIRGDVAEVQKVSSVMQDCWGVIHLAAESHVDRSILDSGPFLQTNVMGTRAMLDAALKNGLKRFLQVSTDEVYGSLELDDPAFTEQHNLLPNSPYSASKAAGDLLARSYWATYDLNLSITRCSNNYGPFQFPEKLIPLLIRNALQDKSIPVYGDGRQIRDWIFVEDHCRGLMEVFEHGKPGEIYNLGGHSEMQNLDLILKILDILGKPESLIKYVKDRPGHDRRYAMDNTKILHELGWQPKFAFETAIQMTVEWYCEHPNWIESVVSGDYQEYYSRQYGDR